MYLHWTCKFAYTSDVGHGGTAMDGRKARSVKTRESIVDAAIALIEAGDLRPTAAAVAERAGLSVRSVFQHFSDLEDLFVAVSEHRAAAVAEYYRPIAYEGSLTERLARFVDRVCTRNEVIAPVRRAGELQEPFSATIQRGLKLARKLAHAEVHTAFADEIATADARGDVHMKHALVAASGFSAWDCLRRQCDLDAADARATVERTLVGILGARAIAENAVATGSGAASAAGAAVPTGRDDGDGDDVPAAANVPDKH